MDEQQYKMIIGWQKFDTGKGKFVKTFQSLIFKKLNRLFFDTKEFNALPEAKQKDPHQVCERMTGTLEECNVLKDKVMNTKKKNYKETLDDIKNSKFIRLIPRKVRSKIFNALNDNKLNRFDKLSNVLMVVGIYLYIDVVKVDSKPSP